MYNLKQFLRLFVYSILFWTLAFFLFIFIRFVAYGEEQEAIHSVSDNTSDIFSWLHFGVILGVLIGTVYALVEFLFEKLITKNIYLGLAILLKTIIYLVLLVFSFLFIINLAEIEMDIDLVNDISWWLNNGIFWVVISYFFIASLVFQFVKLANEKFGRGVLFNMISGKYRKPIEEERLFMFIDLKSSTTLAEKLGHYKYSQLLQDCFFDLNRIIGRYNAEVYQYVGDEAVLSWDYKKGIKNRRCIDLYFDFQKLLVKRSNYYLKNYEIEPFFKAGIHGGKLIVTEVGTLKKELAYHGDVINTTSRIQEACNKYNQSLLISENILKDLNLKSKYKSEKIGDLLLKGKKDKLKIYGIHEI
ncbi:adenylate/guanylate cyclase domain-containing protein [Algibacter luteus]|uniref:Adenylate cyclase n=1 Tax=Algibacter luteus TaxID=1178825 RepID=A0A1M6FQR9_9FLAO|nr:adenylate/guanylate cyclase domain-containing protein [Algibacter luteus]SHJ00057.1 adenylate cyclase [Algibacter luteus]